MKLNQILPWRKDDQQLGRMRLAGYPLNLLHRRMDHLFDDFFNGGLSDTLSRMREEFAPQIDLRDTGSEVRITAELPGLEEKDVEVTLTDDMLTLSGEKREEHEEEKDGYYHCERSYGSFERHVRLPEGVDSDKAVAKFKKGVLEIAIPKRPEARVNRRKIELQSE